MQKPVVFTRNRLVLVVPTSNPAGIHSVYDLKKPGIKLVIAAPAVPVGSYTLQVLKQMGLTASVLANVVSRESDVRSVLSKVALGEADAGFVYSTDARTVPGKVKVIKIPAWAQPKVTYSMAVVSSSTQQGGGAAVHQRGPEQGGPEEDARRRLPAAPRSRSRRSSDACAELCSPSPTSSPPGSRSRSWCCRCSRSSSTSRRAS